MTATAEAEVTEQEQTLTEQIAEAKLQVQRRKQRQQQAEETIHNFQKRLDEAIDLQDDLADTYDSVPSEANAQSLTDQQRVVKTLRIQHSDATSAIKRLPNRIKAAMNTLLSLQRQKRNAVTQAARKKYGKKKEIAQDEAREAVRKLIVLTAITNERTDLEAFMSLGDVNSLEVVRQLIADNDFRFDLEQDHHKLVKALKVESL